MILCIGLAVVGASVGGAVGGTVASKAGKASSNTGCVTLSPQITHIPLVKQKADIVNDSASAVHSGNLYIRFNRLRDNILSVLRIKRQP